jgi:P-type Ca2+ transporter type 2C
MSTGADGVDDHHLSTDRSRADSKPQIPTIITSDPSSEYFSPPQTASLVNLPHELEHGDLHAGQSPSDHGLLSPTSILKSGRVSLDAPSSPTGSAWSDHTHVPSSPTSSIRSLPSVSFVPSTTIALRENNPHERNGFSSLGLLQPPSHGGGGHRRKESNASSVGTVADTEYHSFAPHSLKPSVSLTHSNFDTVSDGGTTVRERSPSRHQSHKDKDVKGDNASDIEKESERPAAPDVTLDENIDAAPFKFKPYQLASLVDPKNLEALIGMGGVNGLLKGLGTHRNRGLSTKAAALNTGSRTSLPHGLGDRDSPGAGLGASHRHDPLGEGTSMDAVPDIKVIGDDGEEGEAQIGDEGLGAGQEDVVDETIYAATMEDRHRVFGENVLPSRKTKSLLQLMWLALKDKVLVRSCCLLGYVHIMRMCR